VFSCEEAEESARNGIDSIMVREITTADDIGGLKAAVGNRVIFTVYNRKSVKCFLEGILTSHGGMTSHAAGKNTHYLHLIQLVS